MKRWIMFVVVLLVSVQVNAQEFSFIPKAGLNLANMVPDGGDMQPGLNIGVAGEYRFSQRFALEPGLYYSMQGYQSDDYGMTARLQCDYLNIPVYARFYLFKGFNIFAGPQLGINVRAKANDKVVSSIQEQGCYLKRITGSIRENVNTFDFSLGVGAGYLFDCGLVVSANYNIGLTNIFKDAGGLSDSMYDNTSNNGVIQINVGWCFRMK